MSKLLHTIRNRLTKQRLKNVVPCDLWKNWTLASSLTFILGCVFIVKGTQLLPLLIQIKLLKKSLAPSEADTRPGWHLSLHVTGAETAPAQDIMTKVGDTWTQKPLPASFMQPTVSCKHLHSWRT